MTTISLAALRAARAKMTPGEWRVTNRQSHIDAKSAWHTIDAVGDRPIVTQLGGYHPQSIDNAAGIVATHGAADTLIEIAEAAQNFALMQESMPPDQFAQSSFDVLWAALSKVAP